MSAHVTFDQMAADILSYPDHAVEIEEIYICSTHTFVNSQRAIIQAKQSAGIDLRYDHECARSKRWLSEVLLEIKEGRTNSVKKFTFNNYLK